MSNTVKKSIVTDLIVIMMMMMVIMIMIMIMTEWVDEPKKYIAVNRFFLQNQQQKKNIQGTTARRHFVRLAQFIFRFLCFLPRHTFLCCSLRCNLYVHIFIYLLGKHGSTAAGCSKRKRNWSSQTDLYTISHVLRITH